MTRVAYLIGTYPLLTTTFIDREVAHLRQRGVQVEVVSIRQPDGVLSTDQTEARRRVRYLLPASPFAVLRDHLRVVRRAAYWRLMGRLVSRPHPSWRARARTLIHVASGVRAAAVLEPLGVDRVHAHFVDRAAIAALTAARLLDVPYSATAHAADIYVSPVLLEEKLRQADFVATCTEHNRDHLMELAPELAAARIARVYHGLDLHQYDPPTLDPPGPPIILAVGQLKEKKGLGELITACRLLRDQGCQLSCVIVGEGPLRDHLEAQVRDLSLEDVVTLTGPLPHDEVIGWYRRAHLFVLPCTTAADGDRDGLPNVILEAMAMGLPVISTPTSAVPEAVEHGRTGLLVEPGDAVPLAAAIEHLLRDDRRRRDMGQLGRLLVAERFDIDRNVDEIYQRFTSPVGAR